MGCADEVYAGGDAVSWTQEEYEELLRKRGPVVRVCAPRETGPMAIPAKKSKHHNVSVTVDGLRFDSKLEARYYKQLKIEGQCGDVFWFTRQVPFWLEGGVKLVVDFLVVRGNKATMQIRQIDIADTKGVMTQTAINKIKQVQSRYPFKVKIIKDADIMDGITA